MRKCAHRAHDVSRLLVQLIIILSLFARSSRFLSACIHGHCFMYGGIYQSSRRCASTQEHEMLTPEGKKVPTRGRGMSAKKTTGQEQENVKEEEEDVEVVEKKAEEKNKEEAKQVGGESGFGWKGNSSHTKRLWRMCVI